MKWLIMVLSLQLSATAFADDTWLRAGIALGEVTGASGQVFTPSERQVLLDYLRSDGRRYETRYETRYEYEDHDRDRYKSSHKSKHKNGKGLPPGLQKKVARGGQLPPGWQKKVARGEVIDTDVYRSSEVLPRRVIERLNYIEGTSVRRIDDRIVRVADATGVILDVLAGR